jgi:uncharacterized protein (DUF885 family)
MARFSNIVGVLTAILALAACGAPSVPSAPPVPPPASPAANATAPRDQLSHLVERYQDEHLESKYAIAPQWLADSLSIERRYLHELTGISRDGLDAQSKLTYDIFKRRRELQVEGFTYPAELLPLGSLHRLLQQIEIVAGDAAQHPWSNPAEYDNWLRRIDDYVRFTQQATANMREGIRRGYTAPRSLIERTIATISALGEDNAANAFNAPLRSMPSTLKDADGSHLKAQLTSAMTERLLPANRALRDFLQHEYLPRGTAGMALLDLPLGGRWYAYRLRRATDTTLSADEIHAMGVAEVERIRARLPADRETALAPVAGPLELQSAYADLSMRVTAALPTLVTQAPKSEFDIRTSEWVQSPGNPLQYEGGFGGKSRATLYVNVAKSALQSGVSQMSFLQQALPGRHLQAALQQERTDLPRFRRLGGEPAFVEGWALYAVSLGAQLGLDATDAAKSEALALQLQCAVALVVDTGLHAKNWSRTQALDYLHAQTALDDAAAQALVDEYAANPADALACTVGEQKFAALRVKAQQVMGGRFEIQGFHSEILKDGAMPLDILDAKMKVWMDAAR